MPIDPRRMAIEPEARNAERLADLERRAGRVDAGSLNRVSALAIVILSGSQVIPTATNAAISFDTLTIDTAGCWNPALPDRLTAPFSGAYMITAYVQMDSNATGDRQLFVGSLVGSSTTPAPTITWQASVGGPVILDAGDPITVTVFQTSGTNRTVTFAKLTLAWMGAVPT